MNENLSPRINGTREANFKSARSLNPQDLSTLKLKDHTERACDEPLRSLSIESLNTEQYRLLKAIFDADYYRRYLRLGYISSEEAWQHFLEFGLQNNLSPSLVIDIDYLKFNLEVQLDRDFYENEIAILTWLKEATETIPGVDWFDNNFYLAHYPDVAGCGVNAFIHFATNGRTEGRLPNPYCLDLANRALTACSVTSVDLMGLIESIPSSFRSTFLSGAHDQELLKLFMPTLYQAQRKDPSDTNAHLLLAHYLLEGWKDNNRPSALWNEATYRENLKRQTKLPGMMQSNYPIDGFIPPTGSRRIFSINTGYKITQIVNVSENGYDEASPKDENAAGDFTYAASEILPLEPYVNPYLHWFFIGRELNIIPTPLFDSEFYCLKNRDILSSWHSYPFEHYLHHAYSEAHRQATPFFNANHYINSNNIDTDNPPIVDYIINGQFRGASPALGIDTSFYLSKKPLQNSHLEETAMQITERLIALKDGVLAEMIARAEALEPQIVRPYGECLTRMAPVIHPEVDLMLEAREIQSALPSTQFDTIVLVPHIRMAGSARIAGKLTQVLKSIDTAGDVLVVTTDASINERPDWFGENTEIFDISRFIVNAPENRKVRALLDLVRGLKAKRLINLNSNLGWRLTTLYGRQLSSWMKLYVYLFCWDRDIRNNKGGYPIQWFLPTFDYCTGVLTDSEDLRDELRGRYCLNAAQESRINSLHTPADDTDVVYTEILKSRQANRGVKRVFWSGRFDRQKRFDLLLGIAESLPSIEFWVWGKPVLNDESIDLTGLPNNIKLMGVYTHIDDVPLASCDLFLYTAAWDGLPTVLIEVGSRGIPIVASAVGGVTDLIRKDTGWPIENADDIGSYCSAIESVLENYPEALDRSKNLRNYTLSKCNEGKYIDAIIRAFDLEPN